VAACLLFSWTVVLLTFDIPKARRLLGDSFGLFPVWSNSRLRQLVVLTLPLGASIAVGSLYNNIPRYVIEYRLGVHDLGIFSALVYFMLFGGMIFTALIQSASPRMARYHVEENKEGFKNILVKLIVIGFTLGLLGVIVATLVGDQIITLIYGEKYAAHSLLLVLLMVAGLVDMTFLGFGSAVNAKRFFRVQIIVTTVSALVVTISSFILIKYLGLNGIVIAMIFTKIIESIFYIIIFRRISGNYYSISQC
jgi:O-antigen/teichoic acid export membrane protein